AEIGTTAMMRRSKEMGYVLLAACRPNQQSYEFPDLHHGAFSYFLIRALRGEALKDSNQNVRLNSVNLYLTDLVEEYVKTHANGRQSPYIDPYNVSQRLPMSRVK